MAQLLIRDVSTEVVDSLKKRALKNKRSLASELRIVLQEAVESPEKSILEEVEQVRSLFSGRRFSDSSSLVREDRER